MSDQIDDKLISIYFNRFINSSIGWFKQRVEDDGKKAGYRYQSPGMITRDGPYEPVSISLISRHLAGTVSCGWTAIDENGSSRWLCFDSDTEDGSLDRLERQLRAWGIHPLREGRRPGRDGHLWILFDKPVPAYKLKILGHTMMKLSRISGLEVFPKSAQGLSQVRGPLGINLKPEANGARGWFDVPPKDIQAQLEWLALQPLNSAESAIENANKFIRHLNGEDNERSQHLNRVYESHILDLIGPAQRIGKEWVTACPICRAEGHDIHGDNLRIDSDGKKFCCWYGGRPGQIHKAAEIVAALLANRTAAKEIQKNSYTGRTRK